MLIAQAPSSLKERCASLVFQHPIARKATILDMLEHALHFCLRFGRDDAWTGDIFTIFSGVGDRVIHVGNTTFIDQIHDQLHLVQALKISHFRRIAGLDQGFEASADQFNQTAAQDSLFAKQIGFAFLAEIGFNDARAAAADCRRIGQSKIECFTALIVLHSHEARHAAALLILAANGVARALWRNHHHIDALRRLDQAEVNREAMGKHQGLTRFDVWCDFSGIELRLDFVRRHNHQSIRLLGSFCNGDDFEARSFCLGS